MVSALGLSLLIFIKHSFTYFFSSIIACIVEYASWHRTHSPMGSFPTCKPFSFRLRRRSVHGFVSRRGRVGSLDRMIEACSSKKRGYLAFFCLPVWVILAVFQRVCNTYTPVVPAATMSILFILFQYRAIFQFSLLLPVRYFCLGFQRKAYSGNGRPSSVPRSTFVRKYIASPL